MNFHFLTDEVLSLVRCPSDCPVLSPRHNSSCQSSQVHAFLVDWRRISIVKDKPQMPCEVLPKIPELSQVDSFNAKSTESSTFDACRAAVAIMHEAAKVFSAQSYEKTAFVPCSIDTILERAPITPIEKKFIKSAFDECSDYYVMCGSLQLTDFVPACIGVTAVLEKVLQRISMLYNPKVRKIMNDHLENPNIAACIGDSAITFLKIIIGRADMLNLRNLVAHGFINSCCPSWVLFLIAITLDSVEKYRMKLLELKVEPITQISQEVSHIVPSIDLSSLNAGLCKWSRICLDRTLVSSVEMFHENGTAPERLTRLLYNYAQDLLVEIGPSVDFEGIIAQHKNMIAIIRYSFRLIPILEAVVRLLFVDYNIDIVPEYYKVSEFSVFFAALDMLIQPSIVLYGSQLVAENGNFFTKPKCAPSINEEKTKSVYENKLVSHMGGIMTLLNDIFSVQSGPRLKDFLFHGDFDVINQTVLWFYLLGVVSISCAGFTRAFYEANPNVSERNASISAYVRNVKMLDRILYRNDCACAICNYHSSCHPAAIARRVAMMNLEIIPQRVSASSEISLLLRTVNENYKKTRALAFDSASIDAMSLHAFQAPKCPLALPCAKALELLHHSEEEWERNEERKATRFDDQVAILQSVRQLVAAFTLAFACTTREFKNTLKCQKKLFCVVERLVVSLKKGRTKDILLMIRNIVDLIEQ